MATSKGLGLLPSTLGSMDDVDWIPVDAMAKIIMELLRFSSQPVTNGLASTNDNNQTTTTTYHGINPMIVRWSTLIHPVLEYFGPSLKLVSWEEWLAALQKGQNEATSVAAHELTGLKLARFFEGIGEARRPRFATAISEQKSRTLRELGPVEPGWMKLWLKQWNF